MAETSPPLEPSVPTEPRKKQKRTGDEMAKDSEHPAYYDSQKFRDLLKSVVMEALAPRDDKVQLEIAALSAKIQWLEMELVKQEELVMKLKKGLDSGYGAQGIDNAVKSSTGTLDYAEEKERRRSIVAIGIPEHSSHFEHEKNLKDIENVDSILKHLDIGARPMAVYRLGKIREDGKPRLLKIVLPSSFNQREVLKRSPKMKLFNTNGHPPVYLRPSLNREQLKEYYEQRARKRNMMMNSTSMIMDTDGTSNNAPKN